MIATFDGASPCLAPFREAAAAFQRESWPVILASAGMSHSASSGWPSTG